MKASKSVLCVVALALMFAITASASDLTRTLNFTYTERNLPGEQATIPSGISNDDVFVGSFVDSAGLTHGFIAKGAKFIQLDDPKANAGSTSVNGVNLDGPVLVVGTYQYGHPRQVRGFFYKNGSYTDVPGPKGSILSDAVSINDIGAIVGFYWDQLGSHGFLLEDGNYTTLDVPGAVNTFATGINNSGQIVLNWQDAYGNYESSLYDNGSYTTINVPGAVWSEARAINSAGDVSYQYTDSAGTTLGALLQAGTYYTFEVPGAAATTGTLTGSLNDLGDIVGSYMGQGQQQGFEASDQ